MPSLYQRIVSYANNGRVDKLEALLAMTRLKQTFPAKAMIVAVKAGHVKAAQWLARRLLDEGVQRPRLLLRFRNPTTSSPRMLHWSVAFQGPCHHCHFCLPESERLAKLVGRPRGCFSTPPSHVRRTPSSVTAAFALRRVFVTLKFLIDPVPMRQHRLAFFTS